MVQVPPHCRRSESQQVAEFSGADGSMFQDGREDSVPRALIGINYRTGGQGATVCGSL
jgi:hypothetical protein